MQNETVQAGKLTPDEEVLTKAADGLFWLGVVQIVIGVLAIFWPPIAGLTASIFFGWLLLISGVVQVVQAFQVKNWKGFLYHFGVGLLALIAGLIVLFVPGIGASALALLYALYFLLIGAAKLALAFQVRGEDRYWWLFLLSGGVSLLVGAYLLIWGANPLVSVYLVGLLFGLDFLFSGSVLVALAQTLKRAKTDLEAAAKAAAKA